MVYEALSGLHSLSPSFSMNPPTAISAAAADAAAAAPINTLLGTGDGGAEGASLHVDAPPRRRRVPFDFSTYQQQHKEAAWTLATFASAGGAAVPQADAGEAVVAVATSHSIHPDDLPVSAWYQKQQRQKQQDQKMPPPSPCLRVDPSSPAPPRPCLVVGPGQFGGQVGLLGSLQPPELTKYLTPKEGGAPKPPRASRTDLSHLTEEEKGDRHREQSRLYSQRKRKQAAVTQMRLENDVEKMRTYKKAINMAPFVMVVLSAHIDNCRVLYVNKPVTEKLGHEAANLLGSSFVMMAHPQDRARLSSVLNECISTSQPHHGRVLCRFCCMKGVGNNHQQPFKQMDMTINIGTKGLICNLWEVRDRR